MRIIVLWVKGRQNRVKVAKKKKENNINRPTTFELMKISRNVFMDQTIWNLVVMKIPHLLSIVNLCGATVIMPQDIIYGRSNTINIYG